jgi:SMC interacting uncharacterized protein involved in chromosome segregation
MGKSYIVRVGSIFQSERERLLRDLETLGIQNISSQELSDFIAEKNKRAKMPTNEVKDFFARLRGLR